MVTPSRKWTEVPVFLGDPSGIALPFLRSGWLPERSIGGSVGGRRFSLPVPDGGVCLFSRLVGCVLNKDKEGTAGCDSSDLTLLQLDSSKRGREKN
ncbi:hypothetical protein MHYP_G00222500 [Metynnis hypsauchen]